MTPPGIRMVLIQAVADRDGDGPEIGHEVMPVLGLLTRVRDEYTCESVYAPRTSPDHAEMIRAGWHHEGGYSEVVPVVLGDPWGAGSPGLDVFDENPLLTPPNVA